MYYRDVALKYLIKLTNHLITLLFSAVFLGVAILFIYVFSGLFSDAKAPMMRIAVVDTGLDLKDPRFTSVLCPTGHADFSGTGIEDVRGHGTHVAGLIKDFAGSANYCIIVVKYANGDEDDKVLNRQAYAALKYAVEQKVTLVNFSVGGSGFQYFEYNLMQQSESIRFIVAAGNNNEDISKDDSKYYPASYGLPNVIPVGALKKDRSGKLRSSNFGPLVQVWEVGEDLLSTLPGGHEGVMSGTSMAAAVHTGKLVREEAVK